jgi:alpha-glucosidase (family GH31 glycosyl hydrolase)
MFGDAFLVAPVVTPENRCTVYLPAGDWLDYWTKQLQSGGRWIHVEAPLDTLPLWVRSGAIIPMGPDLAHSEEKPLDPLIIELYLPNGQGRTVVYDEDRPAVPVHYLRQEGQLTVEVGAAPGQVELILYGLSVRSASRDGQPLTWAPCPGGQIVRFDGTNGGSVVFYF